MNEAKTISVSYRVPYSDCTVGNHVYYAHYLDWLERARNEFFRHIGVTLQSLVERGLMLPVVTCHVDYKDTARYDDEVSIKVWVAEVRKVRLTLDYRITRPADGRLIASAQTVHACTDLAEKPQRLPAELVNALQMTRASE
jgi:acyl-CoA thioester hydrolase